MSDPSLYTNLYSQLRDCAELVDQVIIDLETRGGVKESKERKELTGLLRVLQTSPTSNMSAVLLANVLKENGPARRVNWRDVADAIDRGDVSHGVVDKLETLARALESERSDVQSRMHGSHAR